MRELPILWLGTAGFSVEEKIRLSALAKSFTGPVRWGLSAFPDADAWLVNGSKVRVSDRSTLRVAPGAPTERAVVLNLDDVNRPLVFAEPVPDLIEPLCSVNLALENTVSQALVKLATWLRPRRVQFALGRDIVAQGASLRLGIFHLLARGQLVTVLNFRNGKVGFAPDLSPETLASAEWMRRPPSAGEIPRNFMHTTVAQLSWTYVRHSERDVLPERYRELTVFFRGAPKVPLHWISDTQLALLRELNAEPATMKQLRERTGFADAQIERDLTCLYYAGSVTTTASKAGVSKTAESGSSVSSAPEIADLMQATEAPQFEPGHVPPGLARQYVTVPAPLML